MKPYILVRNWVDDCLAGPRAMSIADAPLTLPTLLGGILAFSLSHDTAMMVIFLIIAFAWAAFVVWRGIRLGRADAFKRDRGGRLAKPKR